MKTIFIDRDGVVNKDPGGWTKHSYVTELDDFHFLPGVFEALKLLRDNGIRVIVISNQAGVGKGHFTKERLGEINSAMIKKVEARGGKIDDVFYCVHKREDNCGCRKPKTGSFEQAARKYNLDLKASFMVGDSDVDVEAGKVLGMKTVFVLSGKATMDDMKKWKVKPDHIFGNLLESVRWILNKEKRRAIRARRREDEEKG